MSRTIGIDLGTSHMCAFALHEGVPVVVVPPTPTAVAVHGDEVLVGSEALELGREDPGAFISDVKRLLGRKFYSPEVRWLADSALYELVPADNGDAWVRLGDRDLSAEQLAAELLGHLRLRAESLGDGPVASAVIAVPAFADERQRRATLQAARIAGLDDAQLVSELSCAAAGHDLDLAGRAALLSLGAGCFDVAIAEPDDAGIALQAVAGDTLLGMGDLDRRLAAHVALELRSRAGATLTEPAARLRLIEACERARRQCDAGGGSKPIEIEAQGRRLTHPGLTSDVYQGHADDELGRLAEPCGWVLEDTGLGTDDIDRVVLFGGGAHSEAARRTVEFLFRRAPEGLADPEAVARGAAKRSAAPATGDVMPHSIGIKVRGGRISPVIERNRPLPSRERKLFAPTRRKQTHMLLEVFGGEGELTSDNVYLGRFLLEDLEPGAARSVTFELDESGILSAAFEARTGERRASFRPSAGLDDEQVATFASERREAESRPRRKPTSLPPPPGRQRPARSLVGAEKATSRETAPTIASVGPPATGKKRRKSVTEMGPIAVGDDSLVGTTVGERYDVEAIMASGGMGRIYRARHRVLDKVFAIKVLHAELARNEGIAERFVREARAAASIDSEHVVDISDFGRLEDGTGFFVMEYLEGTTLTELITNRGALPAKVICDVGAQICNGLHAAHELGIVHRDLKPDNVMVVPRKAQPYFCKILDFGIAKSSTSDSTSGRLTLVGALVGTPHYMAPEQVGGSSVDARADVYALGALMYELACGEPPFSAASVSELLAMHRTEDPVPVASRGRASHLPDALAHTIMRCLEKRPEDRPESAQTLAELLAGI